MHHMKYLQPTYFRDLLIHVLVSAIDLYLNNTDSFPGQVVGSITTESQHHNQNLITVNRKRKGIMT